MVNEIRRDREGQIEEFFPCNCKSKDHYLTVDTFIWDDVVEEVCVCVVVQPSNFKYRLKQCWNILTGKNQATLEEVLFSYEDTKKLDHLIHVLQTARQELKDSKTN